MRASSRCTVRAIFPSRPFERDRPPRLIVIHRHRLHGRRCAAAEVLSRGASNWCIPRDHPLRQPIRSLRRAGAVVGAGRPCDFGSDGRRDPSPACRPVWSVGRDGRPNVPEMPRFLVEVAGSNHDLCRALVVACEAAGYRVRQVAGPEPVAAGGFPAAVSRRGRAIADDRGTCPSWSPTGRTDSSALSRTNGPVIALIGFADRETVTVAKARSGRLPRAAL